MNKHCMPGGFLQIAPVGGISLAALIAKHYMAGALLSYPNAQLKDSERVEAHAAVTFARFKRVTLTKQERASDDPAHTALLEHFDLSRTDPPITEAVLTSIQEVTPDLLRADPAFYDAVFVVQCNLERRIINRLMARAFALRQGLPVFTWFVPLAVGRGKYSSEKAEMFYNADVRELKCYWVPGMPVIYSKRHGHESWGVTNNRTGTARSFSHDPREGFVMPDEACGPEAAGVEIQIPQPKFLHIQLQPMKGENPYAESVIVPVPAVSDEGVAFSEYLSRTTVRNGRPGTVAVRNHTVDPGFALTYEKTQGATIKRIILCLSNLAKPELGHMTLEKFYVAILRVEKGAHVARLAASLSDIVHLTALRYDPLLRLWNSNYDDDGYWKKEPLASPEEGSLFAQISPAVIDTLDIIPIARVRALCRVLGVMYRNIGIDTLPRRIRPAFENFLARTTLVEHP